MLSTPISIKLSSVSQKREFGSALAEQDLTGDGFEFSLPSSREAQHANEFYELLVTFFENGGSEAVSAVAGMITTAIITTFGRGDGKGDKADTPETINITINDIELEISPNMTPNEVQDHLESKLSQTDAT